MYKTLWHPPSVDALLRRMDALAPDTPARWGRMTAGEMLAHVVAGMEMGFGTLPTRPRKGPFRYWPLKHLFVYWLPFPKSAPAPREVVTRGKQHDWEANLAALRTSLVAFGALDRKRVWPIHPIFGRLSARAWGALGWRHLDHHLRQFGV